MSLLSTLVNGPSSGTTTPVSTGSGLSPATQMVLNHIDDIAMSALSSLTMPKAASHVHDTYRLMTAAARGDTGEVLGIAIKKGIEAAFDPKEIERRRAEEEEQKRKQAEDEARRAKEQEALARRLEEEAARRNASTRIDEFLNRERRLYNPNDVLDSSRVIAETQNGHILPAGQRALHPQPEHDRDGSAGTNYLHVRDLASQVGGLSPERREQLKSILDRGDPDERSAVAQVLKDDPHKVVKGVV